MPNRLKTILDAIRTNDYATATESMGQVMQQKVEQRLAIERQRLAQNLVAEDAPSHASVRNTNKAHCEKCGHTWLTADNRAYCIAAGCMSGTYTTVTTPAGKVVKQGEKPGVNESKEFENHCSGCGYSWKTTSEPDKCPDCKSPRIHSKTLEEAPETVLAGNGIPQSLLRDKAGKKRAYDESY
jgi:predicted Zn-ribbon and HTH transcriptional regulator